MRGIVIGTPDETMRAAVERIVDAYVLEFLTAKYDATGRLLEERRT